MPRRQTEVNGTQLNIAVDDEPALGQRVWGVVQARLVDELTGRPPGGPMSIVAEGVRLTPRVTRDGLVGLVGIPTQAFSMLAVQPYDFGITIRAMGYLTVAQQLRLLAQAGFPANFTPLQLGDVLLHRAPTDITGRVLLLAAGGRTPVAGATVRVTGFWPVPPPPNAATPAVPPNLVSIQPSLYAPRAAGVGTVRRRNLTPVAGQDKQLLVARARATTTLRLSDRVGLAAGNILVIDALRPDRQEFIAIVAVAGGGAPTDAATVILAHPLALDHREGAVVRRATPQPPGANNLLTRDAIRGDPCLFLDGLADLAAAQGVEIGGGPAPAEFHSVRRYEVVSDPDGYYRLPPLSRVAQVELAAADGVNTPVPLVHSPQYGVSENRVDLTLE